MKFLVCLVLLLPCRAQQRPEAESNQIRQLILNYTAAVSAADIRLAGQVWDNSPDVSFIYPGGEASGWEGVKRFLVEVMGGLFSERKLTPRDIVIHVYGDSAWSQFNWHFTAKQRKDGAIVQTDGRETQIYRKAAGRWVLVHVHYSEVPKGQ